MLGSCGRRCQRSAGRPRKVPVVDGDEFRNTKIQQFHLPLCGNEDVGWFEIPMDHEVAMRIGNCLAYLREETHPLRQRSVSARAVLRDRLALNELHCHVGPAVCRDASIVKARDTRVLQARQDLPLHVEALELSNRFVPQEFDRDPLREVAFGAHGLVNDTHAAAAYMSRNLPGSHTHVWRDRLDRSLYANACGCREESSELLRGSQEALDLL